MDGTTTIINPPPSPAQDVMEAVRKTAMLVTVSISSWTAMKSDKERVEDLKRQHGAIGNVGRVQINQLTGADQKLKAVISTQAAIRTFHYDMTMPWVTNPHARKKDGPGLLPNVFFHEYVKGYTERKRAVDVALDDFIAAYRQDVSQAQQNLGSMASFDYPTEDQVRAMFTVTVDFQPIPAGSGFQGLPQHTLDALGKAMEQRQQRMLSGALGKLWLEARKRVEHMAERLTDPDPSNPLTDKEWGKRFNSSTIENVRELLTLMPGWNLCGQAEVDECVEDIKNLLVYQGQDVNRDLVIDNVQARDDVAKRAGAIVNKLNKWGV